MILTKKPLIRLSIIFCLFMILCFPHPNAAQENQIERLVVGTTMEIKSIDIADYYYGVIRGIMTHQALIGIDENGEFCGDMADRWETEDGRTWTFLLKPGIVWHDGKPVTAHDVAFTFDYLMKHLPAYRSPFTLLDKVEARDNHTVVIHQTESNPRLLVNLLVMRILPKHRFEHVADPKNFIGAEAAVGSGPYMFDFFDKASGTLAFKSFDQYYRGAPKVKQVIFRNFRNPDVLYMAFRKGEVDIPYFYGSGTEPFHVPPLLKEPHIRIDLLENIGVAKAIFFNTHKSPVNQVDFRKALALAIDYEEILRLFAAGYGSTPNGGFIPRVSREFAKTQPLRYDPDEALKLLKDLGYGNADKDGFLKKDGTTAELELVLRTDIAGNLRIAELLREYFQKIGVKLIIRNVDTAMFIEISDHQRSHTSLLSRTTPWGMMMWAGCGTGYFDRRNYGWTLSDDPRFISIVDRMNAALKPEIYLEAAADLQRYYNDELPAIALYWDVLIQPYHARFHGWKISPIHGFLWEETWFNLSEKR